MNRSALGATALLATATTLTLAQPSARADEPVPPTTVEHTTTEATGPSMAMVGSGIVIFGVAYVPAVIVGAASGLDADRTLFVPIAGPWIDFANRPGCGAGSNCNAENTNKVLLATDGVFQAIGALTVIGGFLTPAHETRTVRSADAGPTLWLTPAQVGGSGYGMMASGAF